MNKLPPMGFALYLLMTCASATDARQVPSGIQSLFTTQDTVIAMQSAGPLGNDANGTVVVVRHPLADGQQGNPCELVVLKNGDSHFLTSEKNDKIVDCTYNQTPRNASSLGMNHNLTVTSGEITYFNELARGGTTYTFAWSKEKSTWHLQHVDASSVQNGDSGVVVYKSVLDYPSSLAWISLADFDPKLIRESIVKHRKTVK